MSKPLDKYRLTDDNALVAMFVKDDDREAIGVLFQRHTPLVLGICYKYFQDREKSRDALMQIFEKLFTDLKKHEVSNFKSWLHSVARNHCLMELRRSGENLSLERDAGNISGKFMESDEGLHQTDKIEKEKQYQALERALTELSREQRICVELFYLRQKTYDEVAAETGFDTGQVKSYIQNGKRNLKIKLEKEHELFGKT